MAGALVRLHQVVTGRRERLEVLQDELNQNKFAQALIVFALHCFKNTKETLVKRARIIMRARGEVVELTSSERRIYPFAYPKHPLPYRLRSSLFFPSLQYFADSAIYRWLHHGNTRRRYWSRARRVEWRRQLRFSASTVRKTRKSSRITVRCVIMSNSFSLSVIYLSLSIRR